MNTSKKRVISLFIALVLILSFSSQTLAAAEKPALTQELIEESTENELSPALLIVPTDESLKVDEEQPQPEPDLKPDIKPDEVTLGASGQETPAGGPGTYAIGDYTTTFSIEGFDVMYNSPPAAEIAGHDGSVKAHFDYLSDFYLRYTGSNVGDFKLTFYDNSWELLNTIGPEKTTEKEVNLSTMVSAVDQKGGSYYFVFESRLNIANVTTVSFKVDFDSITSTVDRPHSPINPTSLTGSSAYGHLDNTGTNTSAGNSTIIIQTWEITGPNNYSETVTGDSIDSLLVYTGDNKLTAGTYTVKLSGAGETVNETVVPDDYITGDSTTFTVQYPTPTVTIDEAVNPTSIVVAKEFTDSTYTWQVYEWDGTAETPVTGFSGTGGTADASSALDLLAIKNLSVGFYRVRIVETDATNSDIAGETYGDFTIVGPLVVPALVGGFTSTPASPALPANPTLGTGTPKFSDSIVTWEIIDEGGSPTGITGTNATDLEAALTTLPEAKYQLQFTETSSYNGLMHSDSVPFQIINPLTSSTVDKPTNPTLGTGTQKMPAGESVVTWEILDSNNQVVGSGTGLTVPKTEFDKLANGDYKLKFTETSGYNQAVHSHEVPFKMDVATPIAKGTLEVKHIFLDENGNVVTTPATITNNYTENVGTAYTTTSLISSAIPDGYRLVTSKLPANASDTYKTTPTVVEYYYEPIPKVQPGQGTVTAVHTIQHTDGSVTTYVTEDPMIDDIGTPYTTAPIAIPGYILKEIPSNDDGTITTGNQTVTYVYIPDVEQAQLTEQHLIIDEAGNVIGVVDVVATARPHGTPYTTTAKAPAAMNW